MTRLRPSGNDRRKKRDPTSIVESQVHDGVIQALSNLGDILAEIARNDDGETERDPPHIKMKPAGEDGGLDQGYPRVETELPHDKE